MIGHPCETYNSFFEDYVLSENIPIQIDSASPWSWWSTLLAVYIRSNKQTNLIKQTNVIQEVVPQVVSRLIDTLTKEKKQGDQICFSTEKRLEITNFIYHSCQHIIPLDRVA